MTGLLASVTSAGEARIALNAGADIIDLKNPAEGALGALPLDVIREAVHAVNGRKPVSATIGDLPPEPTRLSTAVEATIGTGVDYVKIGLFDSGCCDDYLNILAPLAGHASLIAVLFADDLSTKSAVEEQIPPAPPFVKGGEELMPPPFVKGGMGGISIFTSKLIARLAEAGFAGMMLDTADKSGGGLRQYMNSHQLSSFIATSHRYNLLCGLAGSLDVEDIEPLLELAPDYLGFRTALCHRGQRNAAVDPKAMEIVRARIPLLERESRVPA